MVWIFLILLAPAIGYYLVGPLVARAGKSDQCLRIFVDVVRWVTFGQVQIIVDDDRPKRKG